MCNRNEALQILREVYDQCLPIVPIADAYLYGSYARGDFREGSDVDIMLISPLSTDEVRKHTWDFAHVSSEVSMDHDVTVSLSVRSQDEFKPQLIPYHRNVVNEGISIATMR